MGRPDVIIAGGGIIGLMAGWTLARAGAGVTVIDASMPAATNAAAGMLAPSFEKSLHKGGDALVAFSMASLARWRAVHQLLEEDSGINIDFDAGGILSVAFDDAEAAVFEKDNDGGEWLSRKDALALEPSISPAMVGARFAKSDGQVDPRRVLRALAAAFLKCGGALRRGGRVAEILSGHGLVSGVLLSDGERVAAPAVIIATGARLAGLADLPPGAAFPVKGEALALARTGPAPSRVVRTASAYLCPKSDGRIVIGATEVKGDWSLDPDDARVGDLKKGALFAIPSLKDAGEIERWAGLRPATRDGAPVIGPPPQGPKGLHYALGHYRNGVLLAPATADALAVLIIDGRLSPEIAAFSAARFFNLGVS